MDDDSVIGVTDAGKLKSAVEDFVAVYVALRSDRMLEPQIHPELWAVLEGAARMACSALGVDMDACLALAGVAGSINRHLDESRCVAG